MDELVDLIVEKTGIPEATAEKVVEVVLDFLKKKLPAPIADSLENLLEGDGSTDLLGGLAGLFGGKN